MILLFTNFINEILNISEPYCIPNLNEESS